MASYEEGRKSLQIETILLKETDTASQKQLSSIQLRYQCQACRIEGDLRNALKDLRDENGLMNLININQNRPILKNKEIIQLLESTNTIRKESETHFKEFDGIEYTEETLGCS